MVRKKPSARNQPKQGTPADHARKKGVVWAGKPKKKK